MLYLGCGGLRSDGYHYNGPGSTRRAFFAGIAACLVGTSCSRGSLSRSLAQKSILDHEHDRYSAECAVDFSDVKDPSLLALRPKLGTSMAAFTVKIARIAITSETTRDAVFWETKTYDVAKLAALEAWADSLYARLSAEPVQAVAERRSSDQKNPRCSSYHFAVVDPVSGWRVDIASKNAFYQWSEAEIDGACRPGDDMFVETAQKAAKTVKLSKDDFWQSVPYSLSQHLGLHPPSNLKVVDDAKGNFAGWSSLRVAHFQLFDDGWRITDIVNSKEE